MKMVLIALVASWCLVGAVHAQEQDQTETEQQPIDPAEPATPATAPAQQVKLMGMNAAALESLLGKPSLLRPEPPAQLWQYADDQCVLQVYLYEPALGGDTVVEHVEARMRGADQPPMSVDQVPDCLVAKGTNSPLPDGAE